MASEWVPPVTTPEQFERLTAIEPGFPHYMRKQVNEWVFAASYQSNVWQPGVPQFLALVMKMDFSDYEYHFAEDVKRLSDSDLANVIDCMFYHEVPSAIRDATTLGRILDAGRSAWAVTFDDDGDPRLTERLLTGVQLAYEDVVNKAAKAGGLLAEAFEAAYGTTPNPNHSYDLSVKAVETLASPAFIPNNTTRATLGAVIGHLEQKTVSLPLIEKHANHGETITKMMRLLWEGGQRHGNGTYEHISLQGARTAQALAFSLVALIHEGLISAS